MSTRNVLTGFVAAILLGSAGQAMPHATAAQSPSFSLSTTFPNEASATAGQSQNYQIRNGGIQWKQSDLEGQSFRIVSTPPSPATPDDPSDPQQPGEDPKDGSSGGIKPAPYPFLPQPQPEPPTPPAPSPPVRPAPPDIEEPLPEPVPPFDPGIPAHPAPGEDPQDSLPDTDVLPPLADPLRLRFFDAIDPVVPDCPVCVCDAPSCPHLPSAPVTSTENRHLASVLIALGALLGVGGLMLLFALGRRRKEQQASARRITTRKKRKTKKGASLGRKKGAWLAGIGILLFIPTMASVVSASSVPKTHHYNGHLLTSAGAAISTPHTIRFSYWTSADHVAGDTTAGGAINAGAAAYVGWQEVHTVTPDARGYFSVMLGSNTPLPDFSSMSAAELTSLHLQVEVKVAGNPDTSYELLDPDPGDDTHDRSPIVSVPFSLNAEQLNQRSVGTGSGSIPILGSGGVLPQSMIPDGTHSDVFTIDGDDSATEFITLQFGETLGKTLTYDIVQSRFTFNANVRIEGNLQVTGLINGVDISTLQGEGSALQPSSGSGLTLNVAQGNYRINGTVSTHSGSSLSLDDDTTNYVFFEANGLTYNTTGFPADRSYIPVAQVTTGGGEIHTVTDKRIAASDDRETTIVHTFHPEFEKASYQGDGTDNVGQLTVGHDNISLHNFYVWTSTRPSLQDYDILVRLTLPKHFVRWSTAGETPISIGYRSTSNDAANNKLDIQVYDTNGVPVTLSGSTTNLASTSWETTHIGFAGSPTWTAGEDFLIRLRVSAKDDFQIHVGSLRLRQVELQKE